MTDAVPEVFHINPETGRPNVCRDGDTCKYGGADFHYPSKHDAEVAWKARQLERGIIAYRSVMQARERDVAEHSFDSIAKKARGNAKKVSFGVVRSLITRNLTKYLVNSFGLITSYLIVSGQWLKDDWLRRLLPTLATVVLVVLVLWFGFRIWHGSRHTVRRIQKRRVVRQAKRAATPD